MLCLKSVKTKTKKKSGCGSMENAADEVTCSHTLQALATSQGFTASFRYSMLLFLAFKMKAADDLQKKSVIHIGLPRLLSKFVFYFT